MHTTPVLAECVAKKEVFDGIRYAEFFYEDRYDGVKQTDVDILNIKTFNHDLKLEWIIDRAYCRVPELNICCVWNRVKLTGFNRNISGNVVLYGSDGYVSTFTFDGTSFPFVKDLFGERIRSEAFDCVTIKMYIYHESEKIPAVIKDYSDVLKYNRQDIQFVFRDEKIPACRQIVSANSDVFASMFESEMLEKQTGRVEISDIEPNIFKFLLNFMYYGRLDTKNLEELLKLIVAADKYAVRGLVSLCGYRISNNLNIDNAVDILILADSVREEFLKTDCIFFIQKNKDNIGASEGYKNLVQSGRADLISEVFLYSSLK